MHNAGCERHFGAGRGLLPGTFRKISPPAGKGKGYKSGEAPRKVAEGYFRGG